MNYLIFIFSVCLVSCSQNIPKNEPPTVLANEAKTVGSVIDNSSTVQTDLALSKVSETIGYVTISNLDIQKKDLGIFDSKQAELACKKLGHGWRLPKESEMNLIYNENEHLGEFKTKYYLGMDTVPNAINENEEIKRYLRVSIMDGEIITLQSDNELYSQYGVRAVRDHSSKN
jgi:hypothetical protein